MRLSEQETELRLIDPVVNQIAEDNGLTVAHQLTVKRGGMYYKSPAKPKRVGSGVADYVLSDLNGPLVVVEAKSATRLRWPATRFGALSQATFYAMALGAPTVIVTDGYLWLLLDLVDDGLELVHSFPVLEAVSLGDLTKLAVLDDDDVLDAQCSLGYSSSFVGRRVPLI